ncbi:hypothetical protein KPA97_20365, partial [Burkholderia cenocepacia]|nr:hypothetical protein [Burkholderia cenocepacia]
EFVPKITLYATTVGRAILSEILPHGLPFSVLNKPLKKKEISRLINTAFRKCGLRATVVFADQLMQSGFRLATRAGISICVDDMLVPPQKETIVGDNNVLFPANGDPSIVPSQDIVLGLYYATREAINGKGEGLSFTGVSEVIRAYENKEVELASRVNVRITEMVRNEDTSEGAPEFVPKITLYATTVGRAILSEILPHG